MFMSRMPSILRNNSRFRRDQRQPPEEEEMWFNEEDDFEDVPTDTKIAPDLDNSISKKVFISFERVKFKKICHFNFKGKIMDKKADMINGPKSHHPQVTPSPNVQQPQQTPPTQTIVNSTNKNISVSNNNRKSSETVTSSPDDEQKELPEPKAQIEKPATTSVTAAAKALAAALGEESEEDTSLPETSSTSLKTEELQQPPQLASSSDTVNVDSSNNEEMAVTVEKESEMTEPEVKADEEDSSVKKVKFVSQNLTIK